jgi:protocadherin Fat 1/2/3
VARIAHVVVEVSVMDLNDNPPMFVNQPYYAVISKEAARDSQGTEMWDTNIYGRGRGEEYDILEFRVA